jgi:hypothetical protein
MVRRIVKYLAELFIALFLAFVAIYIFGFFGVVIEPKTTDFFVDTTLGLILILFVGIVALTFFVMMVVFWEMDNKWKDLRFKMAFYLYHSRVNRNDKIPLAYLARVGVCTINDISTTLENMVARNELKGIVDREEGIYIHKGLTRRGMKVLAALPPAGVSGLNQIKQYALKGPNWEDDDNIEELEEVELEELPSPGTIFEKRKTNKVACPHCGRMNVKEHQFCTFCGEVV